MSLTFQFVEEWAIGTRRVCNLFRFGAVPYHVITKRSDTTTN